MPSQKPQTPEDIESMAKALSSEDLTLVPCAKADPASVLAILAADKGFDDYDLRQWWQENKTVQENLQPLADWSFAQGYHRFFVKMKDREGYIGEFYLTFHASCVEIGYYVTPPMRRQGLSKKMCREFLEKIQEKGRDFGIEEVIADVEPGNLISLKTLRSSGFEEVGLKESLYPECAGEMGIRFRKIVRPKEGIRRHNPKPRAPGF